VRFTEINLFGVYVAPMSSMMGCRLGGDDRTALVAARFGLTQYVLLAQRHRRRVANVLVFEKLLRSLCNWKGPLSVVGPSAAISSTAPQPAASTVIARNPRDDDSVVGDRVADQRPMGLLGARGQGAKDDAGGAPNSRRLQPGGRQRELIVHRAAEGRQRMRLSVLTAAAHRS